jgi:hypothetical protein
MRSKVSCGITVSPAFGPDARESPQTDNGFARNTKRTGRPTVCTQFGEVPKREGLFEVADGHQPQCLL